MLEEEDDEDNEDDEEDEGLQKTFFLQKRLWKESRVSGLFYNMTNCIFILINFNKENERQHDERTTV